MRHAKQFTLVATIAVFALVCPLAFGQQFPKDRRICYGDYAFCSASTCTPTGGQILVNTATGQASFPAASCTCPILHGLDEVEVDGGNMTGSCYTPNAATVWSGFWPHATTPQQLANWQDVAAPGLICGSDLMLGNKSVNCYSFSCQRAGTINGVQVATCTCPIGETFDGTPIAPDTAFFTQAGQCSVSYCSQYPVSDPIGFDDLTQSGECFRWPPGGTLSSDLLQDKLAPGLSRDGKQKRDSSTPVSTSSR
jgi:hypothetical protein